MTIPHIAKDPNHIVVLAFSKPLAAERDSHIAQIFNDRGAFECMRPFTNVYRSEEEFNAAAVPGEEITWVGREGQWQHTGEDEGGRVAQILHDLPWEPPRGF